eukprot:336650-Rhodomonas_salina.3
MTMTIRLAMTMTMTMTMTMGVAAQLHRRQGMAAVRDQIRHQHPGKLPGHSPYAPAFDRNASNTPDVFARC